MANIAIFRINYKSDFILTLNSDAGWMTPFCIKFWTGAPSQAYFASFDGTTYTHCAPVDGEPTKLRVQFDDHHLLIGDLQFQIGYHFTVNDFPTSVEDEVLNQASVIIEVDGEPAQVMLDLNGETAPEIEFSLPAYANEAQRIANEQARIEAEQQRIANEEARIQNEETRISAEQARQTNEEQRIANETGRVTEFAGIKTEAVSATNAANAAASLANEKADYAQAQGDYAKEQGDTALADHTTAAADHTQAVADHTQAASDHTRAEEDHSTASADHTTATSDHTQAVTDHTQAGSDHTRAESDHTRAESDHAAVEVYVDSLGAFDISAYHATGGVLAKYADLTAALGTNGANIPDALRKGGMSVKFVQSSDNNYVQYRLTSQNFTTDITQWQGVDSEIKQGSKNLIENGAVFEFGSKIKLPYILNKGLISDSGTISPTSGYHYTSHLPIIDGYTYEVWGATDDIAAYCYSEPRFDSSCFLGLTTSGNKLRTGTKYVAYRFADANVNYDNIEIVSKKEIEEILLGSPLKISDKDFHIADASKLRKQNILLFKNTIQDLYFYGSAVDRSVVYSLYIEVTSSSARFAVSNPSSVLDKSIDISTQKVVDTILTQGNYNLRVVADFTGVIFSGIGLVANRLNLSDKAFNGANISFQNEEDIKHLNDRIDNIGDNITIEGVEFKETNVTNYYNTAELGYINASNGQKVTAGQTSNYCTDYIPTNGASALKTLCEAGSGTGGAFYTSQSESSFISGFRNSTGADGKNYVTVPINAKYFRTSMSKTDYDNGKAIIVLRGYENKPIADFLQYVKPRNTKVLFGYEEFVEGESNSSNVWSPSSTLIDGSRQNLTLATENDNARQIWSKDRFYLSRSVFEISLKVNDADSFFSVGATEGTILNELRVHNVAGVGTMEIYVGADSFDTYESITPTVITSKAMSFNIVAGEEYKLGFRRIENETYNNIEHMDGVEYYMINLADGTKESIFIPRDSAIQNGVRNGLSTLVEGYRFISLKVGDIEVYNMFVSSMYAPQAKAMIIGDSYVDGDTLIGTDKTTGCGQKNKFACLLQSAISQTEFVVGGRGGERISETSMEYILWEIAKFLPKYLIIDLGGNNASSSPNSTTAFNDYKTSMEELISEIVKLKLNPVLMTLMPLSGKLTFIDLVNNWVRSSGYRYVDMNKAVTIDSDGHTWNPDYVKADGIHPTVLGHEAIYNAFVKELPELFAV